MEKMVTLECHRWASEGSFKPARTTRCRSQRNSLMARLASPCHAGHGRIGMMVAIRYHANVASPRKSVIKRNPRKKVPAPTPNRILLLDHPVCSRSEEHTSELQSI